MVSPSGKISNEIMTLVDMAERKQKAPIKEQEVPEFGLDIDQLTKSYDLIVKQSEIFKTAAKK